MPENHGCRSSPTQAGIPGDDLAGWKLLAGGGESPVPSRMPSGDRHGSSPSSALTKLRLCRRVPSAPVVR